MRIDVAHKGKITGLAFADSNRLLTCGVDRNIKLWDFRAVDENGAGPSEVRSTCRVHWKISNCTFSVPATKTLERFPRKDSFQVSRRIQLRSVRHIDMHTVQ